MLIEYGVDRFKRGLLNTTRGSLAGILSLAGTYGIAPQLNTDNLSVPYSKVLDYIPTYSPDPYTQCGGEGYLDNETVLITPQDDETLILESLGIIPGECDNPEELVLQPQPTATPVPPMPTKTPVPIPPPPKSPVPLPTVSNVQKLPQIKGDVTCVDQTNKALNLLKEKSLIHYNLVINYLGIVECVEKESQAYPEEEPPRAVFGNEDRGTDYVWYASSLTHEACHSWQYQRYYALYTSVNYRQVSDSTLNEWEYECGKVQIDALTKLGASADFIREFKEIVNRYKP